MNICLLIGRLATEPELKYTPSGVAVCNFRLAVDREVPSNNGQTDTDFHDLVSWRQDAEFAANYLTKGRLVAARGEMQVRNWVANDGTKRRTVELVVRRLKALDRPVSANGGAPSEAPPLPEEPAASVGAGSARSGSNGNGHGPGVSPAIADQLSGGDPFDPDSLEAAAGAG